MNIIVGITGGIAAYKSPLLVRLLVGAGHKVRCVATQHALEFVTKLTLETVSGNNLYCDLFDSHNEHYTEHIALKDWCDLAVVAPATANIIGKMASGIADDALSTLLLSLSRKPIVVCPAMNTQMWENSAVQHNIAALKATGVRFIGPKEGELACGTSGTGRMEEPEAIAQAIAQLASEQRNNDLPDLSGEEILITAGPTYEKIDPVRFIGNYSSGKMGFALANVLSMSGAKVHLVCGPVNGTLQCDPRVDRTDVESAREMFEAATKIFPSCSGAILAAAVADYRPAEYADHKLKKNGAAGMTIELVQNPDILATLGKNKADGQRLVGFALETNDEQANAEQKLQKKNLDYIVMNSLRDEGAGFGVDTNKVTIIGRDGSSWQSPLCSKRQIAEEIVKRIFAK